MQTAQNLVTAQFTSVEDGIEGTFTVKAGRTCVVIWCSRSPPTCTTPFKALKAFVMRS
jgi:hypothetical protein